MNILIKLTCLIGLVIAPILGGHSAETTKEECCAKTEACALKETKCDMTKCATMTKDECAKMCDDNGCSPEEKAMCMAQYDENGKFIGASKTVKTDVNKQVIVKNESENGKSKATVTTTTTKDGKTTEAVEVFEGTEAEVQAKLDALK